MTSRSRKLHHRNIPLLLMRARERMISYFRPVLNAHGITEQQWRIVRLLLEAPALEPRQIGELCAISSPSMAGVLERMEQAGYITRRRVEHDQRRVLVSLTAKSRGWLLRWLRRLTPPTAGSKNRSAGSSASDCMKRWISCWRSYRLSPKIRNAPG